MTPQTDTPFSTTTGTDTTATPKPGWQTSELALTAGSVLAFALGQVPQQYAPVVAGIVGVYVAARTLLKAVHALGYAKAVPDLPSLPEGTTVTNTTITQVPKS